MSKIAVVGAGVTGVTTAYYLARDGHEVTIIDKNDGAALETSFANGGQISASNAGVWNDWHTIKTAIASLFRESSPIRIAPRPTWHKISWLIEFLMAGRHARENTVRLAMLALESRQALLRIAAEAQIKFDMRQTGLLHVYKTREQFDAAIKSNRILTSAGLDRFPVTANEIRNIEPALHGSYFGGLYTPEDFAGDVHQFSRNLMGACTRLGVETSFGWLVDDLHFRGEVIDIERHRLNDFGGSASNSIITADKIVICAGVGSRQLAKQAGDRVNIYPVKGYSLTLPLNPGLERAESPEVCLLDEDAKIVTSRLGDRLRVAGTAEFDGYDTSISQRRIQVLIDWCNEHFPRIDTASANPWAGLRPMLPRMVPLVGLGHRPNVLYNTGHGHLGWTLSAATAEMIATLASK